MQKTKDKKLHIINWCRFVVRTLLFAFFGTVYIIGKIKGWQHPFGGIEFNKAILMPLWLMFAFEVVAKFVPNNTENVGCHKQHKKFFEPTGKTTPKLLPWKKTLLVAVVWIVPNLVFGILYLTGIVDSGFLFMATLFYAMGDMICVLFFCPFQVWFMQNRCCTNCRIYNWDMMFMFTPFVFIPHLYTYSLVALALVLLVWWEVAYHTHPERFSESTNKNLTCASCTAKTCQNKKQLKNYIKKHSDKFFDKGEKDETN